MNKPEPPHCVTYHEFSQVLAKVYNDKTLNTIQRYIALRLKLSIDRTHYNNCIE